MDTLRLTLGVQARLNNLRFECGDIDGDFRRRSQGALQAFEKAAGLLPTGKISPTLVAALRHYCNEASESGFTALGEGNDDVIFDDFDPTDEGYWENEIATIEAEVELLGSAGGSSISARYDELFAQREQAMAELENLRREQQRWHEAHADGASPEFDEDGDEPAHIQAVKWVPKAPSFYWVSGVDGLLVVESRVKVKDTPTDLPTEDPDDPDDPVDPVDRDPVDPSDKAVQTQLPVHGEGYWHYNSGRGTGWGRASTIRFIEELGRAWKTQRPDGPRLLIGDLSIKGGGPCPNGRKDDDGNKLYHKSHDKGVDFDVQVIRGDGKEGYRSATIDDESTHVGTQELVRLMFEVAGRYGGPEIKLILTAQPSVLKAALSRDDYRDKIIPESGHRCHLHVRLK